MQTADPAGDGVDVAVRVRDVPASAIRSTVRSTGGSISAVLYRGSASRIADGIACAPVGESEVRHIGTPRRTASA
ncbi:hypothetical protein [Microbacterium tumbae]